MKEINEKDLEQAAGGSSSPARKYDKFESKDVICQYSPDYLRTCSLCTHYDAKLEGHCNLK